MFNVSRLRQYDSAGLPISFISCKGVGATNWLGDLDDVREHLPALLRHHTVERAVPLDYLGVGLDRELPEDLDRFVDEWASPDTVPDDVYDDAAKYFSHVLIAEARARMAESAAQV